MTRGSPRGRLGDRRIVAEVEGNFTLGADLGGSFASSTVWEQHSSLTTIYDPATTQIQWWRVVVPRLSYVELAEFNACGDRVASAEVFLRDLRDNRRLRRVTSALSCPARR